MSLEKILTKLLYYFHLHRRRGLNIIGSPYGLKESFNWVVKHLVVDAYYPFVAFHSFMYFFPIIKVYIWWVILTNVILALSILVLIYRKYQRNKNKIENIGGLTKDGWRLYKLNSLDSSHKILNIAFVGDIMRVHDYKLGFVKKLMEFFKDIDLVIGNLEGVITNKSRRFNPQNHSKSILKLLPLLKVPPQKWLLCLSNNHAADYDLLDLKKTQLILKKNNYNFFGTKSSPSFSYHNLNVVAGSMWSNRKDNGFFTRFKSIDNYYKAFSFI
ncbi:MAG: CapA family protein, partial [Candidatus Thorarchaeota archaeon]